MTNEERKNESIEWIPKRTDPKSFYAVERPLGEEIRALRYDDSELSDRIERIEDEQRQHMEMLQADNRRLDALEGKPGSRNLYRVVDGLHVLGDQTPRDYVPVVNNEPFAKRVTIQMWRQRVEAAERERDEAIRNLARYMTTDNAARVEAAKARAKVDELQTDAAVIREDFDSQQRALDSARISIQRLREALEQYGKHQRWCLSWEGKPCTCGFADTVLGESL